MQDWDVIVLGCGSAGSRAAREAQAAGARCLAIDSSVELGGLCILRGCMPTKTLLETAHRMHDIHDASRFGIEVGGDVQLDFAAMMERCHSLVKRFQRAKVASIEGAEYSLLRGQPRFVDPHTIEVDGAQHRAKAIVIATGSTVRSIDEGEGGARVLTSDDMFTLDRKPDAALVIGGGAVGIEFATWLARIGCRTTLVNRSPLLHRKDRAIGAELMQALAEEMELIVPGTIHGMRREGDATVVEVSSGDDGQIVTRHVDFVLNAVGRVPSFDGLAIENAGFDADSDVLTNGESLRTEQAHIFVAGDVSAKHGILHEANREGTLAGRNAARVAGVLDGEIEDFDRSIPASEVIFCDPPYASCGLTPQQCEARGIDFEVAEKRFPEQGRGIVMGARYGRVRLLCAPADGRVLGCQVFGPRGDDLMQIVVSVMTMGGTVHDMMRIPWYHPTLAEAFIEVARSLASR